jgi:DNA-binding MarR family transcriptional regulator
MARKTLEKPLTDTDYRALAEFRHQLRQFLLFSENAAREAGLQPRHHQALLAIKGFPNSTVGDLAARLGIKHHSAVELANRLVAAKLIRRTTDPVDRRCVHLALTQTAEKKLEELTLAHRAELRRLATLWGPLFEVLALDASPVPNQR